MALISLHSVCFSYAGPDCLRDITFHLESGERVCVIGRNGAGKSTFLHLLSGTLSPGAGHVEISSGLRIGFLPQMVPDITDHHVFEVVARGLGPAGGTLAGMNSVSRSSTPNKTEIMDRLRHRLGDIPDWELIHRVERTIQECRLDSRTEVATMSAGMKRRVLFARALVHDPHVLVLDEPTNHLDISTIQWLEELLSGAGKTLVFVTHDRMLIEKLATRIVEIDRGNLVNWACDYSTYLQKRDRLLTTENRRKTRLERKLKSETAWLHRGIKARRTRNEGRVKALKELRRERKAWREMTGSVTMQIQSAHQSGRMVIDAQNVSFSYDAHPVIRDFSTTILKRDRIGIMGPNGCGKSTLLRLLLGDLQPQKGSIRHGTKLAISYFDQLRQQLNPDASVLDSIAGGLHEIIINGNKRHVYSYLKDFLFDPAAAEAPVRTLSGGERNRLLLARLFTKESNLLVMDEPTNDLDADTLDILENQLMEYSGTVLVVSHDRAFLNNVVHAMFVFEDDGRIVEYAGGYDDWLVQKKCVLPPVTSAGQNTTGGHSGRNKRIHPVEKTRKLSFHLVRELEALPGEIDRLETQISQLYAAMSSPDFYREKPDRIREIQQQLREKQALLETKIERWTELDDLNSL
jgi:ABC transport system ATP-binding/permease protein